MSFFTMQRSITAVSFKTFCLAMGILVTGCGVSQSDAVKTEVAPSGAPVADAAPPMATKGNPAKAGTIHVFLVGGQSNAEGAVTAQGLPDALKAPQADVYYFSNISGGLTTLQPVGTAAAVNGRRFGPEITFGRSMADYYAASGSHVAILKHAEGGTSLYKDWKADGTKDSKGDAPSYARFQSTIDAGIAALKAAHPGSTITMDGMIWMQGESDANPTNSPVYQTNLSTFITDVRLNYGDKLNFVIGRLSPKQTFNNNIAATDLNNVRTAQANLGTAGPHNGLVSTDDLPLQNDQIHFTADAQIALGTSFAKAMQTLISSSKPADSK